MTDFGKWAFNNSKLVCFCVAVLIVGGILSAYRMSKLEDPEIKVKLAMVVAVRPGASAHEMELEVTDPLEKSIRTIGELDNVQSWSYNDLAILQIEIKRTVPDSQVEQCWDMLRRKVYDTSLPEGTSVQVQDDFGLVYGMFYALVGEDFSEQELSDYANLIKREVTDIPGVVRVEIYGERQQCINVELLPEKIASLGVSPVEVISTLQGQNGTYYAGYYDNGSRRTRVSVANKFKTGEQIRQMIIRGHEDDMLRLGDIATVSEDYSEPVRNSLTHNGKRALGVAVAAASGTDIVKVGDEVEAVLDNLIESRLPAGLECEKVFYQPQRVIDALAVFFINLIESVIIVIAILMLTMGFRSGIIIGISLLTIVIGSFLLLGMANGSMQRVSLAAFILAMGMLVDNAIVIVDGILVDMKLGKPRMEAMTAIGRKTAMPLLGATLIAILAFLPVFLSPDTAGVYVRDLFIVLAVSLLLSWILALVHVPLMCNVWLGKGRTKNREKQIPAELAASAESTKSAESTNSAESAALSGTDTESLYQGKIYSCLRKALHFGLRHRFASIACAVVLVLLSLYAARFMHKGFFPDMVYDQLYMEYKLPEGTNSSRVASDLKEIEEHLRQRKEITDITASVGGTPARYNLVRSIATPSLSYGELIISFSSVGALEQSMEEIQQELLAMYPDAYINLKKYNIMYKKYPIEILFAGPDPAVLHTLADSAMSIMKESSHVRLITTDWEPQVPLLSVGYEQSAARTAGLSRQDISTSILTATGGIPVGTFYDGLHKNTIYLKCTEPNGAPVDNLENVPLFSMLPDFTALVDEQTLLELNLGTLDSGEMVEKLLHTVPLGTVSSGIEFEWENPVIPRYNGQRTVTVMCSPVPGVDTETARLSIAGKIEQIPLPDGYELLWRGEKEASSQTMYYLFNNVPLSVVLMIAILILLFKDYKKPAIIICCIPLLAVGVVGAMLITGKAFTFCAIVGALGLVGMLIKNCIVLMDEVGVQINSGKKPFEALVSSSESRLRPVMMASLTTILGMIPLLGDAMFGPMAAAIMGGLLFSTFATLFFVPVLYAVFFRVKSNDE